MQMSEEVPITARFNAEVLAALDGWISGEPDPKPTREEAVAVAVCEWLAAQRRISPEACAHDAA
jgi:hypothetical protein